MPEPPAGFGLQHIGRNSMSLPDRFFDEMRHLYLFEPLDDTELRQVMGHAKLLELSADDVLFAQGDTSRNFYIVHSGMIKLFRISADGTEKILELITANQVLGEDAMFVGEHSAYADALEATQVISVDCRYLSTLLRENTKLCLRMMTLMSHRSQKMIEEIGNLTLQSAIQRVTQYLIGENGVLGDIASTIRLNLPKQVIASRLGVKPETLSRIIARLRNEGMIDCTHKDIVLKNMTALQQIANGGLWLKLNTDRSIKQAA
jgi:CRP-like cAMP-binding protein